MRRPLALLPALVAAGSVAVGCGEEEDATPTARSTPPGPPRHEGGQGLAAEAPVDRMTLPEQVGQTIVFSFEGAIAPPYVLDILREGRAGGVILFGDNVASGPRPLRRLTAGLQRAAGGSALIATDQEGGDVRILPFAPPARGQRQLSGPAAARAASAAAARALDRLGVNVNLAPVVDVGSPGGALAGRAFPGGPDEVATLADAAVRAYGAGRPVAPTVKHFPGLGAAQANTDQAPVTIGRTRAQLEARDLPPFRAAIAAGVPLVMASHARYPALDPRRIASQSPRVLRGLLRERLGFDGVVITDSIEARAVLDRSGVATAAVRSVRAGADIVLSTGSGSYRDVYDALLVAARRSPSFRARVREAAVRVLALKRRMGLRAGGRTRP